MTNGLSKRKIRLNSGRVVEVIDYSATPPPPEGHLRCIYCGEIKPIAANVPYSEQSRHTSCITGIDDQAFMGCGWGGWEPLTAVPMSESKPNE